MATKIDKIVDLKQFFSLQVELERPAKIAKALNVANMDVQYHLKKYKSELNKLKSDYETGLLELVDVSHIINDTPPEKVKQEPTVEETLRNEIESLNNVIKDQAGIIERNGKDIKGLKKENEVLTLETTKHIDHIKSLKQKQKEKEDARVKATTILNQRTKKYENLMRASTKRIELLTAENERLKKSKGEQVNKVMEVDLAVRDLEQHHAGEIAKYENQIKERDTAIKELENKIDELKAEGYAMANDIKSWKGKYLDLENAYKALEEESTRKFPAIDYKVEKIQTDKSQIVKLDLVNKPPHYNYGKVEVIDIIEQIIEHYPSKMANSIGNVIKYIARAPHKGVLAQDLEKAAWYLDRAMSHVKVKDNGKVAK